jgi:hypothetical protein
MQREEETTVLTSLIPKRMIMPILAMSLIAVGTTQIIVSEAAEEKAVSVQQRQADIETELRIEMPDDALMQAPPEAIDFMPRQKGYHILVEKSERKMTMFVSGRGYRTYTIDLGFTPEGHKTRRGDGRTPEGEYYVCKRNTKSAYYRSLLISYPSPDDARQGVDSGLVNGSVLSAVIAAYQRGASPRRTPDWVAASVFTEKEAAPARGRTGRQAASPLPIKRWRRFLVSSRSGRRLPSDRRSGKAPTWPAAAWGLLQTSA